MKCTCCGYAEDVPNDGKWRLCPRCQTINDQPMQTPETKAGRLTELVMARVRGKLPELPTHEYNRVYECVLAELNCHVLGETHEIPEASDRRSNVELSHTPPKSL